MKKCKIIIMAALAVFAVAALAGCGNADNEETGSNPDSDNGVVEQIVTDAATGAKEVITDGAQPEITYSDNPAEKKQIKKKRSVKNSDEIA